MDPKMEKGNEAVRMLKMGQTIKSNGTYQRTGCDRLKGHV